MKNKLGETLLIYAFVFAGLVVMVGLAVWVAGKWVVKKVGSKNVSK